MRIGDEFYTHDYNIVATAKYASREFELGEVIVLSDKASYHVAVRMGDGDERATLEDTFHYDEPTAPRAYCDAIRLMARIASAR